MNNNNMVYSTPSSGTKEKWPRFIRGHKGLTMANTTLNASQQTKNRITAKQALRAPSTEPLEGLPSEEAMRAPCHLVPWDNPR